jgi:hypothetical protein
VAHLVRVYDALLAATEVVDHDLTSLDDREVVEVVARYVRHQDGLDFSSGRPARWDAHALAAHVRSQLPTRGPELPHAQTSAGAELRRFCRERGIALPHRATPLGGDKAHGLSDAIRRAAGDVRAPRLIAVITDLDGVVDYALIAKTARLLRKRGHTLSVAVPDAHALRQEPETTEIERDLAVVYRRSERRRLREAKELFGKMGIAVRTLAPGRYGLTVDGRAEPSRVA